MTNKIAIFLGLLIIGFLAVDHYYHDWAMFNFLLRKLLALIEYMAVWR